MIAIALGRIWFNFASEAITITFEDNGPGVESVHSPLLFERLYRADNSRTLATGGSGLGLSIVRMLVEAQNGEVNAYINSNKGLGIKIIFNWRLKGKVIN